MEVMNKLMELMSGAMGQSAVIAMILEFIFRLIPTAKPLSVLHLVGKFSKIVGNLLLKAAELLDTVLPQNLK